MNREATKRSAIPLALVITGAAVGAYIVLKKRHERQISKAPERITDACARSLATLEQRITALAS